MGCSGERRVQRKSTQTPRLVWIAEAELSAGEVDTGKPWQLKPKQTQTTHVLRETGAL